MKLKDLAGWNQIPADWRRLLALSPEGCFLAELEGRPAGTVTTTRYGNRFAWIGMVLVLPEMRRRGIGTALLKHAIQYLEEAGVACVRLDATPLGEKLYDTLGFQDEYRLERVQGVAQVSESEGNRRRSIRQMAEHDLGDIFSFDAVRFGADRSRLLEILWRQVADLCFLSRGPCGAVDGYIMARPGQNAFQIGPWVAAQTDIAEALFGRTLATLRGENVFLDVLCENARPSRIVRRHGFSVQRPFVRMYRGTRRPPGRAEETFAICGVETG